MEGISVDFQSDMKTENSKPDRKAQLEDYQAFIEEETIERIQKKAARLRHLHAVNANSTFYGGGVAELLTSRARRGFILFRRSLVHFTVILVIVFFVATGQAREVVLITIDGAINPPVAGFIAESIKKAQDKKAEAMLIAMDTPGGLDSSMRKIVKSIMDSAIPVIVYVSPSGARAASAGSIILMASHIAAMAPGTNVGAAHPVSIGTQKPDETMMKKVENDAVAYSRSIALKRGRNAEWAEKAVLESASITADDAKKEKVIDIVANSVDELMDQVNGRAVETRTGRIIMKTKGVTQTKLEMPFKYRFLSYVSDPNVAYLLMMLGIIGIFFEIYSPGAIIPGVAGAISIILALYAFSTIPISVAGVVLIVLGIIFFVLEMEIVSNGILAIAGIIAIVIGSIMLIDDPSGFIAISWKSILTVAIALSIFFFGILAYAVKAQRSKVVTGMEGLVGEFGHAKTDIAHTGKVLVHGELWNAESADIIRSGEAIVVTDVDGLVVKVKKRNRQE
ncbi:MAG TPA: nodulation protein NfeD [Syntrophorhabdaceae bacterium]|nr:nodulation protein NfeD [Syntrophorhabdaceae bacterium]